MEKRRLRISYNGPACRILDDIIFDFAKKQNFMVEGYGYDNSKGKMKFYFIDKGL